MPNNIKVIPNSKILKDLIHIEYIKCQINHLTNKNSHPAAFPVNMSRNNVQNLCSPHHVSWKANSTRYLLFIDERSNVFFVDMNIKIFQVKFEFVDKQMQNYLRNSLLDGEIVCSTTSTDQISTVEYLVYDALVIDGLNICEQPFKFRWEKILTDVINPLETVVKHGSFDEPDIKVTIKEFWVASHHNVSKLLDNYIDGLVFKPSEEGYLSGLSQSVLKWNNDQNSFDFRVKITYSESDVLVCQLLVEYASNPFGAIHEFTDDLAQMDGKIVECKYDLSTGKFKYIRPRPDKIFPNTEANALDIFYGMRHPVTRNYLLNVLAYNEKNQGLKLLN